MLPKKWWQFLILTGLILGLVATALVGLAATLIYPELPSLEALTDYKPKVPMRVYSEEGQLIGEFGEERRAFISIDAVPKKLKEAILAAEDERFYKHGGVDTLGILRAAISNVTSGSFKEGASTITMQVARNFFLSSEKTATRKLSEALLSIKIEHSLTKDQILELYINQIYLGQRSYGFAAASQVYYGKPLDQLSVAEVAMLAGLPKAPSRYNPFANPKRAEARQHYVLRRMKDLHFIEDKQYQAALEEPHRFRKSRKMRDLSADYVAEIVRQAMYERYKDDIYSSGLKIYTTIRKSNQEAANRAVLQGIIDYDRRHGYRGPEKLVKPGNVPANGSSWLDSALDDIEEFQGMMPAVVTQASAKTVSVYAKNGINLDISGEGLALVQKLLSEKDPAKRSIKPGAVVRIMRQGENWHIVQLPQVESGLVSIDPENGAVRALVGGFDFNRNKFNHVTQAWRQPGSSFKPFIYSASLEKGFTPASMIEDEPISISARETGSGSAWEPKNYDRKYDGPMRMRTALTKSKNMVSIRILEGIGVNYAQDYITRFGFSPKDHPPYLAMALGSGSVTAWQMAGAYSVLANGGYRVKPYIIAKIVDSRGNVLEQSKPQLAGKDAPRVIDGRNAFIMTSMLQDVVRIGTATRARQLGRSDLAGKTGTTNNQIDAWFAGYNPKQVAIVWIGFDKPKSLGSVETGGKAALPIWIDYMSSALRGIPDVPLEVPTGVTPILIDPATGMRATGEHSMIEYFYHEFPPPEVEEPASLIPGFPIPGHGQPAPTERQDNTPPRADQLF
ncbi:penicillin-binding protein 1A [Methylobacillus gramineus]|uniref:penicillin-binding protein 1A n=1 Tax=Methylobacillus gramineus TaxID=755169 RepID=UPI001D000783|nr:penicillin-binding protein 1A [Methylobacillus gramineus]MCB5186004.1 penicillin-binding protein 1A [Methylobacillus gramineus]